MAAPSNVTPEKTAADLQLWLQDELSPRVLKKTEILAHGGTALTLLGLKEATKDVDFSFVSREEFERVVAALQNLGYKTDMDLKPRGSERGSEQMFRFVDSRRRVDVVDLRWPTWNNWRITRLVRARSVQIPFGNVTLTRLDKDAIFLFKAFPLRDTDLADLTRILDAGPVDEPRIISLFDEQDEIHRRELMRTDVEYEPLIRILELRARVAGSLELIGPAYRRLIPRIWKNVVGKFRELGLGESPRKLASLLRDEGKVVSWDDLLGADFEKLRGKLALAGS